jgi:hypothetical protein
MIGGLRDEHPRGQPDFAASFRLRSQVYDRARAATMTGIKSMPEAIDFDF